MLGGKAPRTIGQLLDDRGSVQAHAGELDRARGWDGGGLGVAGAAVLDAVEGARVSRDDGTGPGAVRRTGAAAQEVADDSRLLVKVWDAAVHRVPGRLALCCHAHRTGGDPVG